MNKILILGSEGALGHFIVKAVHNCFPSSQVIRVSRKLVSRDGLDMVYYGDLLDSNLAKLIFSSNQISHVIHCAAHWNGLNRDVDILYNNSIITLNVLKHLNTSVKKIVYISSSAIYENANDYTESVEHFNPATTYGMSKLFCENIIKLNAHNIDYTIWRPFHIVSPIEQYKENASHVCTDIAYSIIELTKPVFMDVNRASKKTGFTWVEDISDCIVSNLDNPKTCNEIFNIGSSDKHSVDEIVETIVDIAKKEKLIPSNFEQPKLETKHTDTTECEFNKIFNVLSWKAQTKFYDCVKKFLTFKYCSND